MRRLLPLLAAVLALAASSTASADTFRVERPHASGPSSASFSSSPAISFSQTQSGPMPFAALRAIWQAAGNAYAIPWPVLGAINKVETNFGQNLGPSSAGAVGRLTRAWIYDMVPPFAVLLPAAVIAARCRHAARPYR